MNKKVVMKLRIKKLNWFYLVTLMLSIFCSACAQDAIEETEVIEETDTIEETLVDFNRPDGPYTSEMFAEDFGNGRFYTNNEFAEIENNTCKITFPKGEKVKNTGVGAGPTINEIDKYTMEYKIKYDENFEEGLHGKQFGFGIGAVYTGGRADEARENGDGGSVRIRFDAEGDSISNQLYVYYSEMTGTYGNNPGDQKYSMLRGVWNTIKLTVTMQSSIDNADGRIEVWCNGVKEIDVGSLRFVKKESARKITRILFASFPGGGGIYPTYDNYLHIDDFKWSY